MGIFEKTYRYFVPKRIKNEIGWLTILAFRRDEKTFQNTIPYYDLSEKHIANLQVLTNRDALLGKMPKNSVVAEVGVDNGVFSTKILSACHPAKLHLIDYWGDEKYNLDKMRMVANNFQKEIDSRMVVIHKGLSVDELNKFSDKYFDWVYIDTDHTYLTTKMELEVCSRKVKEGGLIAGHDYVTRDYTNNTRYGVVEAVNEFCWKNDWELVYLTHETNRHLSFAVRKL